MLSKCRVGGINDVHFVSSMRKHSQAGKYSCSNYNARPPLILVPTPPFLGALEDKSQLIARLCLYIRTRGVKVATNRCLVSEIAIMHLVMSSFPVLYVYFVQFAVGLVPLPIYHVHV